MLLAVLAPIVLLHRHYDAAIADSSDRLQRYQRVAAQAPELRAALDAMQQRDGRRFFLRNSAANLAGAELQELVKAAIESNGGRITTSQNTSPREDGRFRADRRQRAVLRGDTRAAEDPARDRDAPAVPDRRQSDGAPAERVPRLQAGAGQEPELNVQLDVGAWAFPRPHPDGAPAKSHRETGNPIAGGRHA